MFASTAADAGDDGETKGTVGGNKSGRGGGGRGEGKVDGSSGRGWGIFRVMYGDNWELGNGSGVGAKVGDDIAVSPVGGVKGESGGNTGSAYE